MWFDVKRTPLLIYGVMHVYNMIKNTRKLNNSIITDVLGDLWLETATSFTLKIY